MQKRHTEYLSDDDSFQFNSFLLGLLPSGLYRGFDFTPTEDEGYISLTTHNNRAEQTNNSQLEKLSGKTKVYNARIEGKFPEFSHPNKEELELKVGAQVMFIKNDSSPEKLYFNGKIGKVILLDKNISFNSQLLELMLLILFGVVIYVSLSYVCQRRNLKDLVEIILSKG